MSVADLLVLAAIVLALIFVMIVVIRYNRMTQHMSDFLDRGFEYYNDKTVLKLFMILMRYGLTMNEAEKVLREIEDVGLLIHDVADE